MECPLTFKTLKNTKAFLVNNQIEEYNVMKIFLFSRKTFAPSKNWNRMCCNKIMDFLLAF